MSDTIAVMPRRKKTPTEPPPAPAEKRTPPTDTVRIEGDLAEMLTIIAIKRKKSISDILSPRIRDWVTTEYRETVRRMSAEMPDS